LASATADATTFLRGDRTWAVAGGAVDVQTFNANGTWTKPATGSLARIQVWSGGGGGGRGGVANAATAGAGGGYFEIVVPLASLGATESVTVGAGGTGRTGSTGIGTSGGSSSFGSITPSLSGGGAGDGASSTPIAGARGGSLVQIVTTYGAFRVPQFEGAEGRISLSAEFEQGLGGIFAGAGSAISTQNFRSNSIFGGGSGAHTGNGGLSVYGGNGGNGGASPTNGTAPAGGGGASSSANINGADGAAGRVIVTVW